MKQVTISISQQRLCLLDGAKVVAEYIISSAANGVGFEEGSFCTPTGRFVVQEKIGDGEPQGTIFRSRQSVGIWDGEPSEQDMVLTRILRLHGLDPENANTMERFIYIHGTNQEELLGAPASCGCIRMSNEDVMEFYEFVHVGTPVCIR